MGTGPGIWCWLFLNQSLMWSLPLPAPPATVTVTFPSPPHALQTPVPGRTRITGFQSCSESHIATAACGFSGPWSLQRSLRLPPAPGWGQQAEGGTGSYFSSAIQAKGLKGRKLALSGAGRWAAFVFLICPLAPCPPSRPSRCIISPRGQVTTQGRLVLGKKM